MPSVQALCAKLTRTHAIERFTGVHSPRGPGERAVRSTKRPEQQPRIRVQRHLRALGISIRTRVASWKKLPIVTFRGHAALQLRRGQILQILDQANDLAMRVELTSAARG